MMRARGAAVAVALLGLPGLVQAGACDSAMMALVYLGNSVDPILAGAPDTAERLATFAERAALAEAEAKAEGWPDDVLANLALLADAPTASPPSAVFGPAQAVADSAETLCEGYPMPYFPAP
ncbi:MAG: hypothetical protein O9328_11135 [Rhodobacteraceae bacterium]|nr:hypothetical protein [Paracoccaceae bacterium]